MPDVLLGFCDYPKTEGHPEFTLALGVNFKGGTGETSGFRFIGREGILRIGGGVTITRTPSERDPGYGVGTFAKAIEHEYIKKYRQDFPGEPPTVESIEDTREEHYHAPEGYSDHDHHHRNFIAAVRQRKPAVEDAAFGYRAAAPALASNLSYFERRVVKWDPEAMREV